MSPREGASAHTHTSTYKQEAATETFSRRTVPVWLKGKDRKVKANALCYNMYYVTRDAYVMTSLWEIKVVLVIRHLEHVLTLEALFLLRFTLDNIPPVLLHSAG